MHRSFSIEIFSSWFQPLDLSINKAPKAYVSEKYNTWIANKILKQLKKGLVSPEVKISLLLSVIKALHAKWIIGLYHQLKADKELIVNGFRVAEMSETIKNPQDITDK